jgi:hypothetical protein
VLAVELARHALQGVVDQGRFCPTRHTCPHPGQQATGNSTDALQIVAGGVDDADRPAARLSRQIAWRLRSAQAIAALLGDFRSCPFLGHWRHGL